MSSNQGVTITWLGHAGVKLDTADGKVIVVDPGPEGNEAAKNLDKVDLLLISHGHSDNMGDAIDIARRTGARVIAMNELCIYMGMKGVDNVSGGNTGGTQTWNDIQVTLVDAVHSSSTIENGQIIYLGEAVGFVIKFPDDFTVYHAGDTALFSDMAEIGKIHQPDVAILPIGDHFTMGPREAAEAIKLLNVTRVIPIHYGTFPLLRGTPEQLAQETSHNLALKIITLQPGQSINQTEIV